MAEKLLLKGQIGQHQCNRCMQLFAHTGNGKWIPTTCPDCLAKTAGPCAVCGVQTRYIPGYGSGDLCLKCWGDLHGVR
jgi:hypothetical protein